VTWVVPSWRLVVPSKLCETPPVARGTPIVVKGGQFCAHEPLQVDIARVSPRKRYRVLPLLATRTSPRAPTLRNAVAVPVAGAAAAGVAVGRAVGADVATLVGAGVGIREGAAVGVGDVPPSVLVVADPHAPSISRLKVPPNNASFCFIESVPPRSSPQICPTPESATNFDTGESYENL
jgi:hypothetical protein